MVRERAGVLLAVLGAALIAGCGMLGGEEPTPGPQATPLEPGVPAASTATASARATAAPTRRATPAAAASSGPTADPSIVRTPVVVGEPGEEEALKTQVKVANTDGEGVFLRKTKAMDDKLTAYKEGTEFAVLGPPEEGEGRQWLHVRAPDGAEGYVPQEFTDW